LAASLAACLALLLLLRIVVDRTTTIATERSMTLTHLLPDQSEVKLNDDSKISYQKDSYGDTRKVTLSGEAFFEVRKGAPFIVETASGTVEVLGTSFNVFSHDNQFKVFCKTGRVRVKAGNSEVILKPSEQTLLDRNKTLTQPARPEADVTWLSGVYKYENVPLTEVCSELERQFNIHIDLSKVPADLKYTGFFEDDNLNEALQSVFWPLKLDPIHKDGTIVIESTGR
jgi:ferric-dicitrate binding protein FerR (iron transport regulator)